MKQLAFCKEFAAPLVAIGLISFFLLSQPVGFDFFYHIYYLQSFSIYSELNQPHSLFGIVVQRYMAFPYIVFLIQNVKPLYVILLFQVLAWLVPSVWILKNSKTSSGVLALIIALMFNFFWTPLTISVGFAATYLISKKPYSLLYLVLSLLFHPLAILICLIAIMILQSRSLLYKLSAALFCIVIFIIVSVYLSGYLNKNNSFKTSVDVSEPWRNQSLMSLVSDPTLSGALSTYPNNSVHSRIKLVNLAVEKSDTFISKHGVNTLQAPIRNSIAIDHNLLLIFKKSKEIVAALLLFCILTRRFLPNICISSIFSTFIISFAVSVSIYKTTTNGSILGSFFIKPIDGAYYDYSVFLALNSYSNPRVNIALSNGLSSCFYSYRKFALIDKDAQSGGYVPLSCYKPKLNSYVIPWSFASSCLVLIKNSTNFKDTDVRFYSDNDGVVFYNMINAYMPNYNSVRSLHSLCRTLPGIND